jgi:hypothetical protein
MAKTTRIVLDVTDMILSTETPRDSKAMGEELFAPIEPGVIDFGQGIQHLVD